ncbi:MAG: glycosyltransferase family 4 protein [Actinomycetota bacterium]
MSAPRVIHLTTTDMSLDWLLRPQLEAFLAHGYDVVGMSAPGPHVAALEASGIRHVAVPSLTRSMSPARDLRAFGDLRRAFRRLAPDIVHTHNPKPGVLGRLAARSAGVPAVVNTVHGLYALPEDRAAKKAVVYGLERIAAGCSDAELLQNEEDLPVLRRLGVPHRKLTVLGNGIDLQRFRPEAAAPGSRERLRREWAVGEQTTVIGVVGRLVWEKGYRAVFEAARLLAELDCRIVVVGPDEPDKVGAVGAADRAAAEESGVRFLGHRDDMVDLYGAFDVYALASHREGFPRSAMEASAMGLPVVASDIRGCRQVVRPRVTGTLFPVDDAAALADALRPLIGDDVRRRRMGDAARARAREHFDDRDVVATTLRTYDWLLARVPAAATASA